MIWLKMYSNVTHYSKLENKIMMNKECNNCGALVNSEMARVFGTNDNELEHCPQCLENNGGMQMLRVGAGVVSDLNEIPDKTTTTIE